ncbi:NlpC/P60 family protein, partial [Clostridium perfringens]
KLSDSYYEPRYVTARRVLSQENYARLVGSAS